MSGVHKQYAAHVDHGVDHTDHGTAIGLSIAGAALGALFVLSTGGAGLAVLAVAGTAGNVTLTVTSMFSPRGKAGVIVTGFDPVRLGPKQKPAARAHPDTRTDCGHEIVEGSLEVVLGAEFAPMSRLEDKEGGGGTIIEGMSEGDVLIVGGPQSQEGVVYAEHSTGLKIASLIYTVMGLPSAFQGGTLSKIAGAGDVVSEGLNQADQSTASTVVGGASGALGTYDWARPYLKGLRP